MPFDRGRQIDHSLPVERIAEQRVGTQDARNRARRGRTQAARLRDGAVLHDLQPGERLAALVIHALGTLIDQVARVFWHELPVFIRNVDAIALLEVDHIVKLERNTDAVIARAHIGARRRDGDTNHFRSPPLTVYAWPRRLRRFHSTARFCSAYPRWTACSCARPARPAPARTYSRPAAPPRASCGRP